MKARNFLFGLSAVVLASSAFAGSAQTQLIITGHVNSTCTAALSTANLSFDFNGSAAPAPANTNLSLTCNSGGATVPTVTAASANTTTPYSLTDGVSGHTSIPYTIAVGTPSGAGGWTAPVATLDSTQTGTVTILQAGSASQVNTTGVVALTVTPGSATSTGTSSGTLLPYGTYTDTVTFSVVF